MKENKTLDLEATLGAFYNKSQTNNKYSNKDVVTFYNDLFKYIAEKETEERAIQLITTMIVRLSKHLGVIFDLDTTNTRNRLNYYLTNLTREEAKKIARDFVERYKKNHLARPPRLAFSLPPLFGRRRNNNFSNAFEYANRQERDMRGGFGAPAPSFNTRRTQSFTGAAPQPPSSLTFPSLPAEQKAAILSQVSRNLTPNQKRVVNTAGGPELVANIVAKAGGANKVKQAAMALQTYSKNNAVKMGLATVAAVNAVNRLGGSVNAVTAAAITNKIVVAMNQKVVANRAAVKRKSKSKPKPKPAPAPKPAIRARLLKAMVKKFTKNELVKIAGENALGSKNNKTKNSLVKNFTKFMRRQPKQKKGSVTDSRAKKTTK